MYDSVGYLKAGHSPLPISTEELRDFQLDEPKYSRRDIMKKIIIAAVATALFSTATYADNAWGNYQWARTTPSFDLFVVNSTTNDWDGYVTAALSD